MLVNSRTTKQVIADKDDDDDDYRCCTRDELLLTALDSAQPKMSNMNLSQAELLKVGPISSRHSLRLLPLSKKKKKVRLAHPSLLALSLLHLHSRSLLVAHVWRVASVRFNSKSSSLAMSTAQCRASR